MTSSTEYETEAGNNFTFDRKTFGMDAGFNMGDDLAVFGQVGRIVSTEWSDFRDFNGDGYAFGFGVKTIAYKGPKADIIPYALFNYNTETMSWKPSDNTTSQVQADVNMYDFVIGSLFALHTNPRFMPYAGFELYPLNQGEMKFKHTVAQIGTGDTVLPVKQTTKFKHNDVLALKFGADATFDKFMIRGEATLIAETTFLFGAGFVF